MNNLTNFYQAIQSWLNKPEECVIEFSPYNGLCFNLKVWARSRNLGVASLLLLREQMGEQFVTAGLDPVAPFNGGSLNAYFAEGDRRESWENEDRLAWVRKHSKEQSC